MPGFRALLEVPDDKYSSGVAAIAAAKNKKSKQLMLHDIFGVPEEAVHTVKNAKRTLAGLHTLFVRHSWIWCGWDPVFQHS